jgi:RND family efflux transporter MFP subunit
MVMRQRIFTLVAFLAAMTPAFATAQGRAASVQTDVVKVSEMTETVTVFGQIVAVRESDVATRVAGIVNVVPIQIGSTVSEGDVLARMDTVRLDIEMASAEAQLAIAVAGLEVSQAQADRADKAFQRAQELTANASISGAQFDDRASALAEALGGLQQARARIGAAENAIDLARYNLTNATIRAPFDGIVLDVTTQVGQFATSGSQVATLLDINTMEVEANVPARFMGALEPGQLVIGKNDAGSALSLTLRAVLPTEFSETRTRPVRFTLTTIESTFAIGQPVTLDVPIGAARDVVVVPKDALVQARGGWTAFVNEDGKAAPRTVTIGGALGDTFEVLAGVVPGDEVVVRGNERLRPGQDIAPMGAGAPDGTGGRPAAAQAGGGDAPAEEG